MIGQNNPRPARRGGDMERGIGLGLAVLTVVGALSSEYAARQRVVHAAAVMAPRFEVDPFWPKPLPNHWILGQTRRRIG
jgi:hypothetical protein